ncbi:MULTISPECIES: non-hydrolyzing UDP-N-acetylglucosamine 2-epimerase [Streptomyces]|uniref:non-hydrolyzing UDP-N-acetylglucosamine 2-epimerase n=1 Tax=Streptomyces TaxID=1883 RepID=UPI00163D1FEA|nr:MULTISPECIES: UDP-N-acetylglucosamine 2-epimerase (non-hydrolyzing) [Streptomyces]MBC2877132.1 UDP-N-acetylglucosamine 2-epimerase (non-hydrolyzing) [Streptomyces sp. TYQ1024]UBI39405.1 UDP-N-acetylglucosamine 2-epimerase (non-hydrolyzing) [Streptomyces mobaraensis]UKW31985.1 UDP-N-acetylglucosamine 2-epimerase (non-hydrolyzing) [Streptomyces sp. TYQ1024]
MSPNMISAPVRAMLILGTRPEAIKLAPVARAMAASPLFEPLVVTTGQHREMLHQMLDLLQVPDRTELDVMRDRQELSTLTARLVDGLGEVVRGLRPDVVLVQGDTTTALTGALAAFYEHVPVAHVEAGLRTGVLDNPFPEELNRRLIGRVARWHFAPTPRAAHHLTAEGVPASEVFTTGNTVIDNLLWVLERGTGQSQFTADPATGLRRVLLTLHRRENQGDTMRGMGRAIRRLAARGDVEILLPLHKSPAVRDALLPELSGHPRVRVVEPLGYLDFSATLAACDLVLTDSGGVQEEAPSLGKPALVLRTTTERPEAVDAGAARLVGTVPDAILAATERLLDDPAEYARMAEAGNPFGDGHATERIIAQLAEDFGADADVPSTDAGVPSTDTGLPSTDQSTDPVIARLPEGPGSYSTA